MTFKEPKVDSRRSSPMESTTRLITIPDYSNLVRLPAADSLEGTTLETFHFRGHVWRITVYSWSLVNGISSYLILRVYLAREHSRSAPDTKINIEILDESGEHTVFDKEQTLGDNDWFNSLQVRRRELEASSCIRNDSFTIRCTLSFLTTSFSEPTMIFKEPKVDSRRSSPMESTTRLITIPNYSNLVRFPAPGSPLWTTLETFHFRGHVWCITVYPKAPDSYNGISSYLDVGVHLQSYDVTRQQSRSASGTKINMEILDESGEHTVFDKEQTLGDNDWFNFMLVSRRELEASWCVRNDSFTVRCTLSFLPSLAGSHKLTIDSFSKHKAALETRECVRSTRFSVGGSTWYIKLYPHWYYNDSKHYCLWSPSLVLTRASSNEPATTVEFNFELLAGDDSGEYNEFRKVTHMFDHASPEHALVVPRTWIAKHDHFIIRCCLVVIRTEMPIPCSESVLTPLSRRSSCLTVTSPEHAQPVSSTSIAGHDSSTVRCTLSLHTRKLSNYLKNLRSFFKPMMIFKEPKVFLAGSHELMINSFSKHKAVIKAETSMPCSESLFTPLLGCHDVRSA